MVIWKSKYLSESFSKLYERARDLIENGPIIVEINMYKPNRSKDQNDYYHRLCKEIADFLTSSGLDGYTKSKVHSVNKFIFNVESTKDLTKEEFCDYITEVTEYWQERTNNYWIPSENPRVYLKNKGY